MCVQELEQGHLRSVFGHYVLVAVILKIPHIRYISGQAAYSYTLTPILPC